MTLPSNDSQPGRGSASDEEFERLSPEGKAQVERAMISIPPEVLDQLLFCDPIKGILVWRPRPVHMFANATQASRWNGRNALKEAFLTRNTCGHLQGSILGRKYLAHRVIWAFHTGLWPELTIDHINGVRDDNRIENLRLVSLTENCRNRRLQANNTSGLNGIRFRDNKWQARITVGQKNIHLGVFSSRDEAITARKAAARAYGFSSTHGEAKNAP